MDFMIWAQTSGNGQNYPVLKDIRRLWVDHGGMVSQMQANYGAIKPEVMAAVYIGLQVFLTNWVRLFP